MPQYILVLRNNPNSEATAPAEMQAIIGRYRSWVEKLAAAGKMGPRSRLEDDPGRHLARNDTGTIVVTDGPYSETKEFIGGFFIVEADDYEGAVAIAKTCPHLDYDGTIELRQIAYSA